MALTKLSTVVAVFDERGQAESAIDKLWHAGFRHDQNLYRFRRSSVAQLAVQVDPGRIKR